MRKKILGITVILMTFLANLYLVSSDGTFERLMMLNDVESIAENNEYDIVLGKELRSFYCESGSEYYECMYADADDKCHYSLETFCGAGDSPAEGGTENPGEVNDLCAYYGHKFIETRCYRTCVRCNLSSFICGD